MKELFLLRKGDKSRWQNEARVLMKLGYPGFREMVPGMLEWLKDLSWPGAEEIVQALADVPGADLAGPVAAAVERALAESDADWLFGLRHLVRETQLAPEMIVGEEIRAALFGEEEEN